MHVAGVADVVAMYKKHGWTLRRILISQPEEISTFDSFVVAESAETFHSKLDAAWFTRRTRPNTETWELRRLTGTPFALVAVIPDTFSDDERENMLGEIEERMSNTESRVGGH